MRLDNPLIFERKIPLTDNRYSIEEMRGSDIGSDSGAAYQSGQYTLGGLTGQPEFTRRDKTDVVRVPFWVFAPHSGKNPVVVKLSDQMENKAQAIQKGLLSLTDNTTMQWLLLTSLVQGRWNCEKYHEFRNFYSQLNFSDPCEDMVPFLEPDALKDGYFVCSDKEKVYVYNYQLCYGCKRGVLTKGVDIDALPDFLHISIYTLSSNPDQTVEVTVKDFTVIYALSPLTILYLTHYSDRLGKYTQSQEPITLLKLLDSYDISKTLGKSVTKNTDEGVCSSCCELHNLSQEKFMQSANAVMATNNQAVIFGLLDVLYADVKRTFSEIYIMLHTSLDDLFKNVKFKSSDDEASFKLFKQELEAASSQLDTLILFCKYLSKIIQVDTGFYSSFNSLPIREGACHRIILSKILSDEKVKSAYFPDDLELSSLDEKGWREVRDTMMQNLDPILFCLGMHPALFDPEQAGKEAMASKASLGLK